MPPPDLDGKYTSGKRRSRLFRSPRRASLPFSLILLALIGLLFWLVPTAPPLTDIFPAGTGFTLPPRTAMPTSTPRPIDEHGGQIIFTCTRSDINQICMINADGTGLVRLTNDDSNDYYPVLDPLSDVVVFASLQQGSFDLFMMLLKDQKLFQLTTAIGNAFSPKFSPDGEQLLFLNQAAQGPSAIWVMGRMGDDPRLLYAGQNPIVAAAWSPDGQSIAFAMSVERAFAYEIFLLDINHPDQPPRRITRGIPDIGGSLDWSPDGTNLLIYAGPVNGREIYRLDLATGDVTQLTFGGNNAAAAYSPDGQYIVFNSLRNNGQADLFIMRADGHSTRQLTDDPEPDWQPQWGP